MTLKLRKSLYPKAALLKASYSFIDKEELCANPERYHMFQFSILQILPKTMTEEKIIELELLWKKKLLSNEFGMNAN